MTDFDATPRSASHYALPGFTPPHPHSTHPHAPVGEWGPDCLGEGFQARTLPLGLDDEGEVVCTLVSYTPATQAPVRGACLYIHGWNDYFFNREMADQLAQAGFVFYAVDLRKYGRSLRPGEPEGYVESISTYDADILACLNIIREEHPGLGITLIGHSTGGLTASLFTHHHPGLIQALILNSPWLETANTSLVRTAAKPIVSMLSEYRDKVPLPIRDGDTYGKMLAGWRPQDGPLPHELAAYPDDPAVVGWDINPAWKQRPGAAIRPGWMRAVLSGHNEVADGLHIDVPILVLASTSSSWFGQQWSPKMRRQDVVLDVQTMVWRATSLGPNLTIYRFDGMHDMFLSDPPVRQAIHEAVRKWIGCTLPVV